MNPNQSRLLNYPAYSARVSNNGTEFTFVTTEEIEYLVYFSEAEGYVSSASFAQEAKMFGFGPTSETRPVGKLPRDERVIVTIFEIVYYFLSQHPNLILLLVCSDESPWEPGFRHPRYAHWRKELFQEWYSEWQKAAWIATVKIDYDLYEPPLHCSCLFRSGNPYEAEVRQVIVDTILAKQP